MTAIDWFAIVIVVLAALGGASQGFVWSGLSLVGLVVGAFVGGRLAPVLLSGGSSSPYAPVLALAGAATLAVTFEVVGSSLGATLRSREPPQVRQLDSAAGVVVGALVGLMVVWVLGAMALQLPGQANLRRAVQRSEVLRRLNSIVPPRSLLNALARVDPFPKLAGPPIPTEPPDPRVLQRPGVRAAAPSVVRVLGTACGLGVEGSGWVARPEVVVTSAHVVAGETDTTVVPPSGGAVLRAVPVAFDPRNDIAVLRVPGLSARPLRLVDPRPGTSVAIVGYPENGPLDAVPGRIGSTRTVLSQDAYGRGPVERTVTSLSGNVRHGDSGGPAVNASGAVETTVFAARVNGSGGYGVPASIVKHALDSARGPVSTGPCT
jgi:S1-C subfamily serine protease